MRGWCSISSFVTSDATAEVEVEAEVLEADLFGWKLKLLKGTATASRANYTIALKNLLKSVMWNQKQKQKHRLEAFWLEAVESNPFCFCFLPLLPWKYFEAISRKLKQWCGSGAVLLPLPLPGKSEDCFRFRFHASGDFQILSMKWNITGWKFFNENRQMWFSKLPSKFNPKVSLPTISIIITFFFSRDSLKIQWAR